MQLKPVRSKWGCLQMTHTTIFDFHGLKISIKSDSSSTFLQIYRTLEHLYDT